MGGDTRRDDPWAEWLLERRFGGDPAVRSEVMEYLGRVRDRVLTNGALAPGESVLDVGCGDGLVAFGALERGAGEVLFADISDELLKRCRELAEDLSLIGRCRFVSAGAENLAPVGSRSVDLVTTRSVLIYVEDKRRAFAEFRRVLRPGGRISLFEPINRLSNCLGAYDVTPVQELFARVRAVFERIQPPESDPMLDFDERDLVELAEEAGFGEVNLQLELESKPPKPQRWEAFLDTSGNPKIPTFAEAMAEALTREERERLSEHLRPLVEGGRGRLRTASAYLQARA
ncbi:MAG: class I SAM-dependent methyltransferase [Actinomycetota bacterium]|nr:class I SAM-dependent methyltransferase [Actinomycetota bacterium]